MSLNRKPNILTGLAGLIPIVILVLIYFMLFPREMSSQQRQFSIIFISIFITIQLILFLLGKSKVKKNMPPLPSEKKGILYKNIPRNIAGMMILTFLGAVLYICGLAYYEPSSFNPFNYTINEIESITIRPTANKSFYKLELLDKSISLTDKNDIKLVIDALKTATPISPNHPSTFWQCNLSIITNNLHYTLEILNTRGEKNGVLVYYLSPNMHFISITRRSDKLGPILEHYAILHNKLNKHHYKKYDICPYVNCF